MMLKKMKKKLQHEHEVLWGWVYIFKETANVNQSLIHINLTCGNSFKAGAKN